MKQTKRFMKKHHWVEPFMKNLILNMIQNITEQITVFAAATAVSILCPAAAPIVLFASGFLYGSGEKAEEKFIDKENRDYWRDSISIGVNGVVEGASTVLKGKGGASLVKMGKMFLSQSGRKVAIGFIKSIFTKEGAKNLLKGLTKGSLQYAGNTLKDTFTEVDIYADTLGLWADDIESGIKYGEWDLKAMAKDLGYSFVTNYAQNLLSNDLQEIIKNSGSLKQASHYKYYTDFDEYHISNKRGTDKWIKSLNSDEFHLIYKYSGEDPLCSYLTMNPLERGTIIETEYITDSFGNIKKQQLIKIRDTKYTIPEFEQNYLGGGEDIISFLNRTQKECDIMHEAMTRHKIGKDTRFYRGVNPDFLDSFEQKGISRYSDVNDIKKALVGETLGDSGFISCSPDPNAPFLQRDINLIMDCGKDVEGVDITDIAEFGKDEKEVLLNSRQDFIIKDVKEENGKIKIYMESIK